MSDRIKVTYLNLPTKPESVLATFGIHIISMDFYLPKIKLVRRKDGGLYLAPPSEKYINQRSGKEEFSNFWWFGPKTSDFFQIEGFKAIRAYCEAKGMPDPTNGQSPALKKQDSASVFDA